MKRLFTALAVALALAACTSLAPKLEQPSMAIPAQYKELAPGERGTWKTAQPAEAQARGEWWKVFDDAVLDQLETEAIDANQSLKAAAARVSQARALVGVANADRAPQVNANFGPTREKPTGVRWACRTAPMCRHSPSGAAC